MKTLLQAALGAVSAVAVTMPVAAVADTSVSRIDGERARVVDYSSRPPFRRRVVAIDSLSAAELARLEGRPAAPRVADSGDTVTVVDYSGRPPFKRRVVPADEAVESTRFARFEEVAEDAGDATERRRGIRQRRFPVRR